MRHALFHSRHILRLFLLTLVMFSKGNSSTQIFQKVRDFLGKQRKR